MKRTTKAPKKKLCLQSKCKLEAKSQGYCRLHYIQNWKLIKFNDQVKAERRLNAYVDKLARKYPADYLEKIKEGLETEEKFKRTIEEIDGEPEAEASETEREYLEKFLRSVKDED